MMNYFKVAASFLMLLGIFGKALAAGPTMVQGNIAQSTEWTLDNSPYVIQSNVTVAPGAILTIDPGVEVHFTSLPTGTGPNLYVKGALKAIGTTQAPINFFPSNPETQWGSIYFYNCDSTNSILNMCRIVGGYITCSGSSPTITSCSISKGIKGIEILANSQPQIVGNRIRGCNYALILSADTSSPMIQKNLITENSYGVYLNGFLAPTFINNDLYGNLKYNIVNNSAKAWDIPNNNFNTSDGNLIARGIYDGTSHPGLGRVNYSPFTIPAGTTMAAASKPAVQVASASTQTASNSSEGGKWLIQLQGGLINPTSSGLSDNFTLGPSFEGLIGYAFSKDFTLGIESGIAEWDTTTAAAALVGPGGINHIPVLLHAQYNVNTGILYPYIFVGAGVAFDYSTGFLPTQTNFELDPGIGFGLNVVKDFNIFVQGTLAMDFVSQAEANQEVIVRTITADNISLSIPIHLGVNLAL